MPEAAWEDDFRPSPVGVCPDCGDLRDGQGHSCGSTVATTPVFAGLGMAPLAVTGYLGDRDEIQAELDGIAAAVRHFYIKQADQVMRECAAYSARLTELCVLLVRVESLDRKYLKLRTQQVERFLKELDQQYKIASRLVEVQRQDLELIKGT